MSLLPEELIERGSLSKVVYIRNLLNWFHSIFQDEINMDDCTEDEGRDGATTETLMKCLIEKTGTKHMKVQLFLSLLFITLVSQGFDREDIRFACSLDPIIPSPNQIPGLKDVRCKEAQDLADSTPTNKKYKKGRTKDIIAACNQTQAAKLVSSLSSSAATSSLLAAEKKTTTTAPFVDDVEVIKKSINPQLYCLNVTNDVLALKLGDIKYPEMLLWVEIYIDDESVALSSKSESNSSSSSSRSSNSSNSNCKGRKSSRTIICLDSDSDDPVESVVEITSASDSAVSSAPTGTTTGSRSGRWINIDVANNLVDPPLHHSKEKQRKNKALAYVVAISSGVELSSASNIIPQVSIVDVTPRYAAEYTSKSLKLRLESFSARQDIALHLNLLPSGQWWKDELLYRSNYKILKNSIRILQEIDELKKFESQRKPLVNTTMPSSLKEMKSHPLFVLEEHIGGRFGFNPDIKKLMGMFKGQRVYNRDAVYPLFSAGQWRKQAKQVIENEISNPVKSLTRKMVSNKRKLNGSEFDYFDSSSNIEKEDVTFGLYGEWQTEQLKRLELQEDGSLPSSEYGNIELWGGNLHLLPAHTVFLEYINAASTAKKLGVEYKLAVVGMEMRGGASVPKMGGIVVHEANASIVIDALHEIESMSVEKAIAKKTTENITRWHDLIKKLLIRNRLREKYGK